MLCYSLFQYIAGAQSSLQASIFSQGSISYSPSNVNLAVIPDNWTGHWGGVGWFSNVFFDYTVERTSGIPSIKSTPHTSADTNNDRECECNWYPVKPGDHIVAKCWIKIDANGDTDAWSGARIGVDLYNQAGGNNYQLWGIEEPTYVNPHDPNGLAESQMYVHWGTSGWTQRTIDFIVPSDYFTKDAKGNTIPSVQVDHIVMWLQVWSSRLGSSEVGNAWFADAELYINT